MRDDLLDAQSAVDWAVAQIKVLQTKLLDWTANKRLYDIDIEDDPQTGEKLLVATLMGPLDPIVNAEIGAVINSIRTALDLLAAALARRNGKNPNADTHFPIFPSEQEMIDPLTGVEGKKWLSRADQITIKSLRPYQGGDDTIWPLHQLDILRKHERLIAARPDAAGFLFRSSNASGTKDRMFLGGTRKIERLEYKSILARFSAEGAVPFSFADGDTQIATFIVFDEPKIGLADAEVAETMMRFADRVAQIIALFDRS